VVSIVRAEATLTQRERGAVFVLHAIVLHVSCVDLLTQLLGHGSLVQPNQSSIAILLLYYCYCYATSVARESKWALDPTVAFSRQSRHPLS
jgi:hypothetical protein